MGDQHEIFSLWDVNGDDTIGVANFGTALRACGVAISDEELQAATSEFADGDKVGWAKFQQAVKKYAHLGDNSVDQLTATFQVFDRHDDGSVQSPDIKYVFTALGDKLSEAEADALIAIGKPDKDGRMMFKPVVDQIK